MPILTACTPPQLVSCPIEVPELWRKPSYDRLLTGWHNISGDKCLTENDARAVIRNQMMCDQYLQDVIELVDHVITP